MSDDLAPPLPLGEVLERVKPLADTIERAKARQAAAQAAGRDRTPARPSPEVIPEVIEAEAEVIGSEVAEIGYAARLFAQLSLPYRDPGDDSRWVRRNGTLQLAVEPGWIRDPSSGEERRAYPYGVMPRLLVTWMATEAVRTQERTLLLGGSLNGFLRTLGLVSRGGRRGDIGRLRDQMTRLFRARLVVDGMAEHFETMASVQLADGYQLWWSPKRPADEPLWQSTVTLSEPFFRSVVEAPVPVDMAALAELRGSALRLDIYTWLTYRMSYLRKPTTVPWESLAFQFGSDNARPREFRRQFLRQLAAVRVVYPAAKVEPSPSGLVLRPSPSHVRRRGLKRGPTS